MPELNLELPQNLEAEVSVLGGMMSCLRTAKEFAVHIKPEWFYSDFHLKVFNCIVGIMAEGIEPDVHLVWQRLRVDDPEVSASRISAMTNTAGFSIKGYTDILRNCYLLRQTIGIAQSMGTRSHDGDPSSDIIHDAGQALRDLKEESQESKANTKRDAGLGAMQGMERELNSPAPVVLTGVTALDQMTDGFRSGQLIIYVAETGTGKTLLAQQTARASCAIGLHGLYVSCEMMAEHLELRELASRTEIPLSSLRHPARLSDVDYKRAFMAAREECPTCQILDGNVGFKEIHQRASKMRREGHLAWVVLDYDELIQAPGKTEIERLQNVAEASKRLAMDYEIPVILISQMRKAQGDEAKRPPSLSRLYSTGAKGKHASIVIHVNRPFVEKLKGDETEADISVLKSRDSQVGRVEAKFDVKTLSFRSL